MHLRFIGRGSRRRQGEPSDRDAGLISVEGERVGRRWREGKGRELKRGKRREEEPWTAVQFQRRFVQADGASSSHCHPLQES